MKNHSVRSKAGVGLATSCVLTALVFSPTATIASQVRIRMATDAERLETAEALYIEAEQQRQVAHAWALSQNEPVRFESNGQLFELVGLEPDGMPMYLETENVNAAISTGADLVRNTAPYNLNGSGWLVGVWDGGSILSTHQEFGARVTVQDGAASHYHATHVGGTVGAAGMVASALGMAPQVDIDSYDWNSAEAEMTTAAATVSADPGKLPISNHSYGLTTGWSSSYSPPRWYGNWGEAKAWRFGAYSSNTRSWDEIAFNAPYYLIFNSAGNDRNDDAPSSGASFDYWNGTAWTNTTYIPGTHPAGDGATDAGYDTIGVRGNAKNVMTVGAVNDAVSGDVRSPANGTVSSFSGWGPTDDGRIKPDIVANGVSLYSTDDDNDSDYTTLSGTSMSSPNAAGTALLVQECFSENNGGQWMRAATLKGLLIHAADDIGNTGPDYTYGWGLMNAQPACDLIIDDASGNARLFEAQLNGSNPSDDYVVSSSGGAPLKATLCWTDPPGTANDVLDDSTSRLVNDLDIRITGPGGTYYPFVLNPASPASLATTGDNTRDNVEQILIATPTAGSYTIAVSHKGTLDGGLQEYSLVFDAGASGGTLDHFDWDPIGPTQSVGVAFPVTITAKDAGGAVVAGFTDTISLSGLYGTAAELFGDDFEDGDYTGWTVEGGTYTRQVTSATAANGSTYSLTQTGGGGHRDGMSYTLPGINPDKIEFHVRSGSTTASDAYVTIGNGNSTDNVAIFFYAKDDGEMGVYDGTAWHMAPYVASQWYKITFYIDWVAETLDYYRDDSLVVADIPFRNSVANFTRLDLYNFDSSQAWWDEIQLIDTLAIGGSVAISPTTSGNFTAGVWSGNVTVQEVATNMFLRADDGSSHLGDSGTFDVVASGSVANGKALYFDQSANLNYGETALGNQGFDTTTVTDFTPFQTALNTGIWEIVVVEVYGSAFSDTVASDVAAYVAGGGQMLFHYWDMDGSVGSTAAATLRSAFGAATTTDFFTPMDVYPWDTGHPVFTTPNTVGTLTVSSDTKNDNGDRVEPAAGAAALGGFTATTTSGEGAIILGNDGNTIYNAFTADDMNDVVALLENEIAYLTRSANVLLISDSNELTGVEPYLAADGHTVTSISNEYANGSINLANLAYLQQFDMVVWGASGSGLGVVHDAAVHSTMESYIQNGGNLLVTGYDTLASPSDTDMAALVRSTTTVDIFPSSFTTLGIDHFILNGPAGDFRNMVITPGYTDWDGPTADIAAGAISLATADGYSYDAIIYTDIPAGGSVGYWTGGDSGSLPSDGKTDWKTPSDSLDILRNWVFGIGGGGTAAGADVAVTKIDSMDPVHQWQTFTYTISVDNNGSLEATGVLVDDVLPAGVAFVSATSSQGTCMNMAGVVYCDIGILASGASASIDIEVIPLGTGALANSVSVSADQTDPDMGNNSATESTTVIPGVDSDGDGIADWWELQYYPNLDAMNQLTDSDGDGILDRYEWIAMTNPTIPSSIFEFVDAGSIGSGEFVLFWDAAPGRAYDIYYTTNLPASPFMPLAMDILYPQNSYTDTVYAADAEKFYELDVHIEGTSNAVQQVGYYDMYLEEGNANQVASILAAGHTATNVLDLTSAELAAVDVLYVQNPDTSYGTEYLAQLTDIQNAVAAGMVLVIHDRYVAGAASILPGGGSISFIYSPNADVEVVNDATPLTDGPGGTVGNTTLDGGTESTHGYATEASLPSGAVSILSQTDPTFAVTFAYPYGSGWVVYSTIPLDWYLEGNGSVPAFSDIYAPNVVDFGAYLAP